MIAAFANYFDIMPFVETLGDAMIGCIYFAS